MNSRLSILCVLLLFSQPSLAQISIITNIIPASRLPALGYWTPGVPGGINKYSTNYTKFCDVKVSIPGTNIVAVGDGTNDDTVALQAALTLCPSNQYVFLTNGHYKTTGQLSVGSGIILRGAGPTNTFIDNYATANSIIHLVATYGLYGWQPLTADVHRGNTSLTVADVSSYTAPYYIMVESFSPTTQQTDYDPAVGWYPVVLTPSANYMIQIDGPTNALNPTATVCIAQWLYVTNIVGNTLYFDRPLNCDYYVTNGCQTVGYMSGYCSHSGVESLCITREVYPTQTANTHGIFFDGCFECWAMNVESVMAYKWHVQVNCGARNEVRNCYLHDTWSGGGDSGYGVGTFDRACDNLAINNVFYHCRHSMVTEWGGQGNVWAYNYSKDPINGDMLPASSTNWTASQIIYVQTNTLTFVMGDMIQHGGCPMFDLWEGNVSARLSFDYVLGNSRYLTAYRNWIQRQSCAVTSGLRAVEDMAYNYNENVVGNILMTPGQTANVYDWYLNGPFPTNGLGVWRFGFAADGDTTQGDTNCMATMIRHLNYDFWTGTNQLMAGIATTNLPPSLFLTSAPDFWPTNLAWPAMGPDVPAETNSASAYPIPAMARFYGAYAATNGAPSTNGPNILWTRIRR